MPFIGRVVVTPLGSDPRRWELVDSFKYEGKTDVFEVPMGFTTDFASVPRFFTWLLPRYGRWTQAAVLHDSLWDLSRRVCYVPLKLLHRNRAKQVNPPSTADILVS